MVKRIALSLWCIFDFSEATRYESAQSVVIGVYVREEKLGDEVRLLVWYVGEMLSIRIAAVTSLFVSGGDANALLVRFIVTVGIAIFQS